MQILSEGAPQRQALDRLRAERSRIEAELDEVSAASLSVDDAVARLMRSLDDARQRAADYFTAFARPGASPDSLNATAMVGVLAWLDPKTFESQVRTRLKALLPAAGLPIEKRAPAIATLKARVTELDELEERAICDLETNGFVVDRRADVELPMLLRVWESLAA